MANQLLYIDGFSKGIINDETKQTKIGFYDMLGIDIWSEDGIAQINNRLELNTTTGLTKNPYSFVFFDNTLLCGTQNKEIWQSNYPVGTTWTLLHTNTYDGDVDDLIVYQDVLIYSSDSRLGTATDTGTFNDNPTWASGTTFTNGNGDHFFKIFNNRLYISDGNLIAELDGASDPSTPTNWIFTPNKFILPLGETIRSLEIVSSYLAIGTESGKLYLWDGASANATQILKTTLGVISAMIQLNNQLLVFAGTTGTVYLYNGAELIPYIQIPRINIGLQTYVRKQAVRRYKNGIIFGLPKNGIYIFNKIDSGDKYSLVKYGNLSGGQTFDQNTGDVYAIYMLDTIEDTQLFNFVVGYSHGINERIDTVSSIKYRMYEAGNNDTSASPYIETQVYEVRNKKGQPTKVQGIQGFFKYISGNTHNIEVEYRVNNDNAYTVLGDIGTYGVNLDKILRGIGKRVDKIQFRIKVGAKTTSTSGFLNTKLIGLRIF